jgi:hypothetical protein
MPALLLGIILTGLLAVIVSAKTATVAQPPASCPGGILGCAAISTYNPTIESNNLNYGFPLRFIRPDSFSVSSQNQVANFNSIEISPGELVFDVALWSLISFGLVMLVTKNPRKK